MTTLFVTKEIASPPPLNHRDIADKLAALGADREFVAWVRAGSGRVGKERVTLHDWRDAWQHCPRGEWLAWAMFRADDSVESAAHRNRVGVLCDVIHELLLHEREWDRETGKAVIALRDYADGGRPIGLAAVETAREFHERKISPAIEYALLYSAGLNDVMRADGQIVRTGEASILAAIHERDERDADNEELAGFATETAAQLISMTIPAPPAPSLF